MEITPNRTAILHKPATDTDDNCVVYVMSRDQRVSCNPALYAAQQLAKEKELPLVVVFCLYPSTGNRSREQYTFMLSGLREVEADLKVLNIGFMFVIGDQKVVLKNTFQHLKPSTVIFDFSPLSGSRALQKKLAHGAPYECLVVDAHNVVPVWAASQKLEVGARTLRPKIHKLLSMYTAETDYNLEPQSQPWPERIMSLVELEPQISEILETIPSNHQKLSFKPGEQAAAQTLEAFINQKFVFYASDRNDPSKGGTSDLSPYLHYGHISTLQIFRRVQEAVLADPSLQPQYDVFVEEMIVRKELSDNYCLFTASYRTLAGAPNWAQNTLQKHTADLREFIYVRNEFEQAQTHDSAWNAAQIQLVKTGKMHGYMRMYWAKKVLEWSSSPQEAIDTLIYLNDFYSIDGGDPNGYTGIMWSVAGVHDRPWGERPVYGVVRCMVYGGLKRKFDIAAYENSWLTKSDTK